MTRPLRSPLAWFRSRPLRSRLALLTAVAVAVAVAAASLACWFVTRAQLEAEMDSSLRSTRLDANGVQSLLAMCRQGTTPPPVAGSYTVQVILANGSVCTSGRPRSRPGPATSRWRGGSWRTSCTR